MPGTYVLIAQSPGLGTTTSSTFAEVPIPVTQRYTFGGAPLSSEAIVFQQFRNVQVYTSQAPPTSAEVQQVIDDGDLNLNILLGNITADSAATPAFASAASTSVDSASTVSPLASGDSSGGSNLESQLLDSGSGDNNLLD